MRGKRLLAFVQTQLICTRFKIEAKRANHRGNWNVGWVLGRQINRDGGTLCCMLDRIGREGGHRTTCWIPRGAVSWLRPGRSAAVASLHSTESAKLHQPLLCLDMQTLTHTLTYIIFLYICNFPETYIFTVPVCHHQCKIPVPPSIHRYPYHQGHNHISSHTNLVCR